jgi:hypothetical protein
MGSYNLAVLSMTEVLGAFTALQSTCSLCHETGKPLNRFSLNFRV